MTDAGRPSKGRSRKRMRLDYGPVANRHAVSPQEHDLLSQIRRHESLDSYARLQSLIGSMLDHFSVSIKAKLCLDNDSHSPVVPSEHVVSQHPTELNPTTYDVDETMFNSDALNVPSNSLEGFAFPSWKETCLPGHERHLPEDANDLEGLPSDLNCLLEDTLGNGMVDEEYESSEDDSGEILERLKELQQSSQEDEARIAIGDFKCP